MEIYIFDAERQMVGVMESFEYFRWTRKFSYCGSFEAHAVADAHNLALLKTGHFLWKSDDEEAGFIEHMELTVEEERESILVTGRFATSLLARRIVWGTEILQGDLSGAAARLITNHAANPADQRRKISGIELSLPFLDSPVNTQISYKNLLAAVEDLCEAADTGIKTVFDPLSKLFTVSLYKGNQSQAVFSQEYENLNEQFYTDSKLDFANTALVGGEGEGPDRVLVAVGGGEGEERYEMFVDAKDLRSEDFNSEYEEALAFRGESALSEHPAVRSYDASVNPHGNLVYKVHFDLGDMVRVVSKKWELSLLTRITEIEEYYDEQGKTINVIFGRGVLTLSQKLRGVV